MKIVDVLNQNKKYIVDQYNSGVSTIKLGKEFGCSNASVWVFLKDNGVNIISQKEQQKEKQKDYPKAVKMSEEGKAIYAISKELNIPLTSLNRYLKKNGYDTSKYCKIREDQVKDHSVEILQKYHSGIGCYKLAQEYKCSESSILRLLHDNNIKIRGVKKYPVNEHFFDVIDTPEKAYVLGIFTGDGNQCRNSFMLCMTDLDIVEKVKRVMEYEGPILISPPRKEGYKTQYRVGFHSRHLTQVLTEKGLPPNKTFLTKFPTEDIVPKSLQGHYLRGVLDSDGSIAKKKDKIATVGYIGNRELMEGIRDWVMSELGIKCSMFNCNNADPRIIIARISGRLQMIKFLDYIYKDSTIHLDRKYQRYLELKNSLSS